MINFLKNPCNSPKQCVFVNDLTRNHSNVSSTVGMEQVKKLPKIFNEAQKISTKAKFQQNYLKFSESVEERIHRRDNFT